MHYTRLAGVWWPSSGSYSPLTLWVFTGHACSTAVVYPPLQCMHIRWLCSVLLWLPCLSVRSMRDTCLSAHPQCGPSASDPAFALAAWRCPPPIHILRLLESQRAGLLPRLLHRPRGLPHQHVARPHSSKWQCETALLPLAASCGLCKGYHASFMPFLECS